MTSSTQPNLPAMLPSAGERFKCDQCGMELEIISACNCVEEEPEFVCCGQPLTSCGLTTMAKTKEAFIDQVDKSLDATREGIAWLRNHADNATEATKNEMARDADLLSGRYEQARDKLNEVKEASNDAWQDIAKNFSTSWQEFKSAFRQAVSRYRSEN